MIYRLWCSRHRDFHEIEQSQHPTLVKILKENNSGCDGRYYYWTGDDNKILETPVVSAFQIRRNYDAD
jgi:hypothetical protein